MDCQDLGFGPGILACAANCMSFNTSGCNTCGNGSIQGAEECDGANLNGGTCATEVDPGAMGTLACEPDCTYDTSDCCIPNGGACMNGVNDAECCSGNCTGGDMCAA
jgi:hypothetical protein